MAIPFRRSLKLCGYILETGKKTASLILAAGRGSRVESYNGNKTLLPLAPKKNPYEGSRPILLQILKSLPAGPTAVVVNYKKEDIIEATHNFNLNYYEQPELNGTGGALLSARPFLERRGYSQLIITMGDVPFVRRDTYRSLVKKLKDNVLVLLGFCPKSKKQYGALEIEGNRVKRIIEWNYWKTYSKTKLKGFRIFNSGIYAARKDDILSYLLVLASRPHTVQKKIDGKLNVVEEFFITDLIEYMSDDGLSVGYVVAEDEEEVMGIDDLSALMKAQEIFRTGKF